MFCASLPDVHRNFRTLRDPFFRPVGRCLLYRVEFLLHWCGNWVTLCTQATRNGQCAPPHAYWSILYPLICIKFYLHFKELGGVCYDNLTLYVPCIILQCVDKPRGGVASRWFIYTLCYDSSRMKYRWPEYSIAQEARDTGSKGTWVLAEYVIRNSWPSLNSLLKLNEGIVSSPSTFACLVHMFVNMAVVTVGPAAAMWNIWWNINRVLHVSREE